jgi:predicted esterase
MKRLGPVSLIIRFLNIPLFLLTCLLAHYIAMADNPGQPTGINAALTSAGVNRSQLAFAIKQVPENERAGMIFLIENMPQRDLTTLSGAYLVSNVNLAYSAWRTSPWKSYVPTDILLNDILPYANLTEDRDESRAMLQEKCEPLITGASTAGEAAQRLNKNIYDLFNVHYSTKRNRADQNPTESIASGLASCSGLSILLVDACRSVGIPARVAGTPLWTNMSGNHTWVEIYDHGWHFVGASEPDSKGLDHSWFTQNAAEAVKTDPVHAIYAVSYLKTGLSFPLVWAPGATYVNAVNVTDRYAAQGLVLKHGDTRLFVKVIGEGGQRIAMPITVSNKLVPGKTLQGVSKNESADQNEYASFDIPSTGSYTVEIDDKSDIITVPFKPSRLLRQTLVIDLKSPSVTRSLKVSVASRLTQEATAYFTASPELQAQWTFPAVDDKLLLTDEPEIRQVVWTAFQAAPIHQQQLSDYQTNQVTFEQYLSPYVVREVGTRPKNGWPLFIAMHGGGGAPKSLNDSQWVIMQTHYKDHPELGGYKYLALRAPNDTWNGFYDVYVYPLIVNLINEFLVNGDVDPDKVFIMGYSHGGYGAFAIGPKEPDRFAAIHASAGAPTDGETTAKTLRNTVFSCMVGQYDTMYDRLSRDQAFAKQVQALKGTRTDIYPVTVDEEMGYEHGNLPDRDKIVDMYPNIRNPIPQELTWLMTDTVITDFFWLRTDTPAKTEEIDAMCKNNTVSITTTPNVTSATLLLDCRLVDFSKPITVTVDGTPVNATFRPNLRTLCETMQRRGDPGLAFTAELKVK